MRFTQARKRTSIWQHRGLKRKKTDILLTQGQALWHHNTQQSDVHHLRHETFMHPPFARAQKSEWFPLFPPLFFSLSLTLSVSHKATHVCVLAKPACPHRRVLSLNPPNNPMILCAYNPLAMLLPDLAAPREMCVYMCVYVCVWALGVGGI